MNSEQERIVGGLWENCFGGALIFKPDRWTNGSISNEPADLVWASDQCVVLIYMQKRSPHSDREVTIARRQKTITHNLKQARGWMNEWKRGRLLVGKNKIRSFSLKHDQSRHIVIISVVECGPDCLIYHKKEEEDLNIEMCVSVPPVVFETLIKIGGCLADLFVIIDFIATSSDAAIEAHTDPIGFTSAYYPAMARRVDPEKKWIGEIVDIEIDIMLQKLASFKSLQPDTINENGHNLLTSVLNDLTLFDRLSILVSLRNFAEITRNFALMPRMTFSISLDSCNAVLIVSKEADMLLAQGATVDAALFKIVDESTPAIRTLIFAYTNDTRKFNIVIPDVSDTRGFIRRFLARRRSQGKSESR